jgi:hypothetical protein
MAGGAFVALALLLVWYLIGILFLSASLAGSPCFLCCETSRLMAFFSWNCDV